MYITLSEITPEIASQMLLKNNHNRKINEKRVSILANDIKNGQWTESPTPISFNKSQELIDGQHRLLAVVRSGCTVKMYVAYDVPDDTVFDKGLERRSGEALYMRGLIDKRVSIARVMAVVNRYMDICGQRNLSDTDKAVFINKYGDYILKSISISKTGSHQAKCDKAGYQTAIFAALLNGVDEDALTRFSRCVNTGFMDSPSESAAIILRNYIEENQMTGSTAANNFAAYTQMCIKDYVNGVPRRNKYKKIYNVYIGNK